MGKIVGTLGSKSVYNFGVLLVDVVMEDVLRGNINDIDKGKGEHYPCAIEDWVNTMRMCFGKLSLV